MRDVFYCTNPVNYTVALDGVLPHSGRPAVVLYKGLRFRPHARPGVWHWRVSYVSFLALRVMAALGWPIGRLYVPHHRIPSGLRALLPRLRDGMAFIDDGMDTLRRVPKNFDLDRLQPGTPYHTFNEPAERPAWLTPLQVVPGCSLRNMLALSAQPLIDLDSIDHVFFESPGLDPQALIQGLGLDPTRVLVLRHPVKAKQGPLPPGCRTALGSDHNPEATMLAARGKQFYFGETLAGVFALRCGVAAHNTLWLQMSAPQWANLCGLPPLQPVDLAGVAASSLRVSRPLLDRSTAESAA